MIHPLTWFRLGFLVALLLLLWLASLFDQTSDYMIGDRHVFGYNWVPWLFAGLETLMLVGFAEIARRVLKDKFVTVTCWLAIPFFACFVWPQFVCERVELTPKLLIHRREPPHTEFNVDIPWNSIRTATKIRREKPGLFAPNFFNVGYEFQLDGGRTQELPSNTVLTKAADEIDSILAKRKIPVAIREIPIPKQ